MSCIRTVVNENNLVQKLRWRAFNHRVHRVVERFGLGREREEKKKEKKEEKKMGGGKRGG